MSDTANTENILKNETAEVQPVIDKLGRSYATGKRKNAVARVWICLLYTSDAADE